MGPITDEYMRDQLAASVPYTVVMLKNTPARWESGADHLVWEHGRRNFALRAEGILPIVCPVTGNGEMAGIGILAVTPEEARQVMDDDPAVRAGIFTYETHPARSFPGDSLPSAPAGPAK